ncbi:hypothetical protein DACRYDRAFT_24540 [Dacryopinax primogenitus]|uniref:MATH domain-containing protein n=1 Tax=Dacryopinax primogenitus (strain DJM 731) TaxID=1858805 RepID=M5G434_DACPD|nr:uncharacterized protein DACRYDRAFT_24540 [Dacryopinax primogenitus]EJT98517.1 hypothetical protein DACRYDRAFT_24540 [Dacryopinax primogenitus]
MERRDTSYNEYLESNTITLEWTLRGLKQLFDSSKGEAKSKVTRSVKFGGGRWQILFYPNSGVTSDGGGYVSLYLSCEPTAEEKAGAINGKWVREGLYKFSFELRNVNKGTLFNTKEAVDHAFSHQTANWGWAQFAKREVVYYSASAVRLQDAFLIICTITSSPTPPIPPSAIPRQLVPRDLLNAVGAILDDPAYSDVEFVLPARANGGRARHIWANRKLLSRAEYFSTMFSSGFAEGISVGNDHSLSIGRSESPGHSQVDDDDSRDMTSAFVTGYPDDSDEDDDDIDDMVSEADFDESESGAETIGVPAELPDIGRDEGIDLPGTTSLVESSRSSKKRKIAHSSHQPPGPPKTKVIVHDVAYATYKAFLYYLYTDSIVFAPLSSNFLISSARQEEAPSLRMSASAASLGLLAKPGEASNMKSQSVPMPSSQSEGSKTRKAWVAEWQASNPDRPGPCSAKAIYRLADKLDLHDLKARAFQHITKSLTTTNVPYEIFSSFSAHFDEVRKVEVDFFLSHWEEIKGSDAMRHIFHQIRNGRHPGFEDVWPYIVTNLVYKPGHIDTASGDAAEG